MKKINNYEELKKIAQENGYLLEHIDMNTELEVELKEVHLTSDDQLELVYDQREYYYYTQEDIDTMNIFNEEDGIDPVDLSVGWHLDRESRETALLSKSLSQRIQCEYCITGLLES